ncbi:hypothetical protein OHA25_51775 [Nonomuraea sp. NBC_00507]|uniref:hypothetical protein n=1 Tax=Nonomuraea sp. NBC_00507 TaxID=2976002 RepID=UPI002E18EF75
MIVADPHEPLGYDEGFTVLLDDWLDGIGGTPDDALRRLNSTTQHDDTLRSDALGGVAAELRHPLYLVNGRTPDTPATFAGTPGRRVRFRVINAAADTALRYDVLVRGRARVRSAASWRHPRPLGIRARRAHLRTACATR